MRTRSKILLCAAAGAAILGGVFAGAPAARADEDAQLIPAWVSGYTVITGAEPEIEAVEIPAEPVLVKTLSTQERCVAGLAPEVQATYTQEELELLAITIYCEAGSDTISDETRRMVGEVVLNRIASPGFPNTMLEVLTAKKQYGSFYVTGVVWPSRASKVGEQHAVERAYACAKAVFTEERLLPEDVVFQAAFVQGREIVVHVPGFYFCR